jgi:hypothetical protein
MDRKRARRRNRDGDAGQKKAARDGDKSLSV